MTLEQFGKELQAARQGKNVSLMDISVETRISVKFLEAIEQGRFDLLPQTYIRAFLREYASFIGVENDEIMKRYALASGETAPAPPSHPQPQQHVPSSSLVLTPLQRQAIIAGIAVIAFVLILFLAHFSKKNEPSAHGTEISFDKVVRETEAASAPQQSQPSAVPTVEPPPAVMEKPAPSDSLRLEMVTSDSVWINIAVDNRPIEDHLYGPHKHRSWSAKNQFIITMGNAGGAAFVLNGKTIGAIGKRGAVVRHYVITDAMLHQ